MEKKKIFLASSSELKEDRKEFEIFINRKNIECVDKGVFLELVIWEDFLDALSQTRLQDEYNKVIRKCDIFVMLFCTKVGKYTEEEFETACGQFNPTFAIRTEKRSFLGINSLETLAFTGVDFQNAL